MADCWGTEASCQFQLPHWLICYRLITKGRLAHKKVYRLPHASQIALLLKFVTFPLFCSLSSPSVVLSSPVAHLQATVLLYLIFHIVICTVSTTVYIGTYYIVIIKELFYGMNWTQTCWKLKLSPCNKNNSKVFGIASCQLECAPCIIFRYSPVTKGHNYQRC